MTLPFGSGDAPPCSAKQRAISCGLERLKRSTVAMSQATVVRTQSGRNCEAGTRKEYGRNPSARSPARGNLAIPASQARQAKTRCSSDPATGSPASEHGDGRTDHFNGKGPPSEVPVGTEEGLKHYSAINLDHVQTVDQRRLHAFVGTVSEAKMRQVCWALALATGCA